MSKVANSQGNSSDGSNLSAPQIWMPDYLADYLAATTHFDLAQHGAVSLLKRYYWRAGSLPKDDKTTAQVLGVSVPRWLSIKPAIVEFFGPGGFAAHLDEERQKAINFREAQRQKVSSRWGGGEASNRQKRSERLAEARKKGRHTPEEWRALLAACGHRCVKCGSRGEHGGLVRDHITPIYQGGSDGIDNIQPLCVSCNSKKGPDSTDYRGLKRLPERLPERLPDAFPSPSPSQDSSREETSPEGTALSFQVGATSKDEALWRWRDPGDGGQIEVVPFDGEAR